MNTPNRWPKVTVVTVVLNAAAIIERTLKSVIAQDYPNIEYIVVDGRSTDGTLELIHKYSHGITRLISEKDGGPYEGMNVGASLASGEWILFMNGGDLFADTDVITRTFSNFKWAECDVIYGDGIYIHEGRRLVEQAPERVTLRDGNGFSHQSTFVRTVLQKEYGFNVSERIAADYDLCLRLYKAGKVFRRADVVVSEFFSDGLSSLPQAETIRLQHRVYKKHLPRSDFRLYFKLAKLAVKQAVRAVVPVKIWQHLKNFRDRGKILSDSIAPPDSPLSQHVKLSTHLDSTTSSPLLHRSPNGCAGERRNGGQV